MGFLGYMYVYIWGFPKIKGTLFACPYNKDYSILGSILGSPYFGRLPYMYIHIHILVQILEKRVMMAAGHAN